MNNNFIVFAGPISVGMMKKMALVAFSIVGFLGCTLLLLLAGLGINGSVVMAEAYC